MSWTVVHWKYTIWKTNIPQYVNMVKDHTFQFLHPVMGPNLIRICRTPLKGRGPHCLPRALVVLWAAAILSSFLGTLGFEQSEWLNSLANGPPPASHLSSPLHLQIPQILQILKSEHCLAEGSEGGFANWVYVHTQGSGATHTPPREERLKRRQEKLTWACFSLKRVQIILSFNI